MLEIDVVDEAIIDGDPSAVRKALIDEAAGRSHWWLPYWQARPHGETPAVIPDPVSWRLHDGKGGGRAGGQCSGLRAA